MERSHKHEPRGVSFTSLPAKDSNRLNLVADLRNEGKFQYNNILQSEGKSAITRKGLSENDCTQCPRCKVLFKKRTLSRHYKQCTGDMKVPKNIISIADGLVKKYSPDLRLCQDLTKHVLPGISADEVTHAIQADPVILEVICFR